MLLSDPETNVLQQLIRLTPDEGPEIPIDRLLPAFRRRKWRLALLMEAISTLEQKDLIKLCNKNKVCISETGIAAVKSM